MERFTQVFAKVSERLGTYLCGAIAFIMMFYVAANVFSRYVLGRGGVVGAYSFVGALLVPLVYLGLSYAWDKKAYIVLDIVQTRVKGRVLWGFEFFYLILTLIFFGAFFYGGVMGALHSYHAATSIGESGFLTTPKWPWEATIVLGTFLAAVRIILTMLKMVITGKVVSADK